MESSLTQSPTHIEDLKARLARLEGKPPAGLVDTAELKAQVHKDLEGFAEELFKECPGGYTNVKGTYYYVPNLGKMSLTTGAFFDTKGELIRVKAKGTTDVLDYWMLIKECNFPQMLRDIKRWLSTSGSIASIKRRKLLKEQRDKDIRRLTGEILFDEFEDVITDSTSGILKRLGCTRITVKAFSAQLREWEKENHLASRRDHVIVVEKQIGKLRGDKGGKSKFTFIRPKSPAYFEWGYERAEKLNKEEEEQYQASLRR
jgi:hypothetical protein